MFFHWIPNDTKTLKGSQPDVYNTNALNDTSVYFLSHIVLFEYILSLSTSILLDYYGFWFCVIIYFELYVCVLFVFHWFAYYVFLFLS